MANGLNGKQNLRSQKGTFDNLVTLHRTIGTVLLPPPRHIELGTLRSEDGDGSENVAEKINSRSFNVHRDYSKSPTLSNAGGSF